MTSLADVYEDNVGEVDDLRRFYLGVALFAAGALLTVVGILVGGTDLLGAVGVGVYDARKVAGVLGGLGVAAGAFPVLAAGALAVFLLVSAVTMHDFWSVDDPEEKQSEMTSFLKNVYGAGAALALLAVGGTAWPYAVGLGLF